jgi:plasmid stabilization system protein ParE
MKKSYDVVWAERAEKNLRDIVAYIANENPTQALKNIEQH